MLCSGWPARARSGIIPALYGRPGTVQQRYYEWVKRGVFLYIFNALNDDSDFESLSIDSTVIRAHQHAAGAPPKKGALEPRASGVPEAA